MFWNYRLVLRQIHSADVPPFHGKGHQDRNTEVCAPVKSEGDGEGTVKFCHDLVESDEDYCKVFYDSV